MTTSEVNQTVLDVQGLSQLEQGMEAVERAMFEAVNSDVEVLRDASRHILAAGGKRIRPRMMLLAYLASGGQDLSYIAAPAAAVELMHTASVVHDDINDHGVVRRGRPSVNSIWGRTFALLTGDFLFTSVYQLMAPYKDLNILLAHAATALVEGETLQAQAVKNNTFTSEIYMRIISLKTAALFEAATEIGARLADADEVSVKRLKSFGYSVGLAFQIEDDILDIIGDESKLGKNAGIDIAQGRGFASIQEEGASEPGEDLMNSIKRKMLAGDRVHKAKMQSALLIENAIHNLSELPESVARDELVALARFVISRDH